MQRITMNGLPPLPKLRPRPGLQRHHHLLQATAASGTTAASAATAAAAAAAAATVTTVNSKVRQHQQLAATTTAARAAEDNLDDGTSRLLMKTDVKGGGGGGGSGGGGGGRGRSRGGGGGSLVHSIPKFSQVRPNERLAEVQKVLQSRIISKQLQKQQREMQLQLQQQQQQQQQLKKNQEVQLNGLEAVRPRTPKFHADPGLGASSLLQNMVSLHHDSAVVSAPPPLEVLSGGGSGGSGRHPKIPSQAAGSAATTPPVKCGKRRGRKPAKEEICHLVTHAVLEMEKERVSDKNTNQTLPEPEVTIRRVVEGKAEQQKRPFPTGIPILSEVTITPADAPVAASDRALDLRKDRESSPEVVEIDPPSPKQQQQRQRQQQQQQQQQQQRQQLPPMLYPSDYERLGSPSGYVFCPETNVFVHPATLQSHLKAMQEEQHQQARVVLYTCIVPYNRVSKNSGLSEVPISKFSPRQVHHKRRPNAGTPESAQSGARPASAESGVGSRKRRLHDASSEVSICKFKFTGGDRPSLEKRKMLSVDSGGNLHYYSSSSSSSSLPSSSVAGNSADSSGNSNNKSVTQVRDVVASSEKEGKLFFLRSW